MFQALIKALDFIYKRKKEPNVKGFRNQVVDSKMVTPLCILTEVILCTNDMQLFLQGSRLNFMAIQLRVKNLVEIFLKKAENPSLPAGSYYIKVDEYIDRVYQ